MKKAKFKPEITRVKLNPEQAVLQCNCIDLGKLGSAGSRGTLNVCYNLEGDKRHPTGICYIEAQGTNPSS